MDTVPIEIVRVILAIAVKNGRLTYAKLWLGGDPLSIFREQQALIRNLGSVCNRWRSICLEFLFEHVWVAPPLESNTLVFRQIFNTSTLLKRSTNPLGWWTRQLYLDLLFLEPPERQALIDHFHINKPFPNVDHLYIFNCGRNGNEENDKLILDVNAKHLISLTLDGSEDALHSMISGTIGELSQLQELALDISDESLPPQDKRDSLVFPRVHTLHIRQYSLTECLTLVDWEFPSVHTLAIYEMYLLPDQLGRFIRIHGWTLTSLSIPYWPLESSSHDDLFRTCGTLERLEVLDALWLDDDVFEHISLTYLPIMGEHRLREWIFNPFWVTCNFDTFQESTVEPKLLPSLHKIIFMSPGVDKLFSLSLKRVQSLKDWSRALKLRGVLLVDDEDGTLIFLSLVEILISFLVPYFE
jgi:hypothetical protein